MKCKHCGQEVNKINLDRLKSFRRKEDMDDLIGELCEDKCPFKTFCFDQLCMLMILEAWLFEKANK